ncbi:MAG: hypothetical protein L0Y72_31695 [Gemmataceae bacterium]|nr:hypothetical protein [Gemmataceae bacterium]MCI0743617.1 hypothetical protein [Gemmataceae bacterium]
MNKQRKTLAAKAETLWNKRDLPTLSKLCDLPHASKIPEVWFFSGLARNALGNKRGAVECWRRAIELDAQNDAAVRALAFELVNSDPVSAAELFNNLVGMNQANADDLTALAEIRIKQDRLGEAQRLLDKALKLDGKNSLALLAMATLYAQVRDKALALEYLKKVVDADQIDISELERDPEFEFLWSDREFERIVAQSA